MKLLVAVARASGFVLDVLGLEVQLDWDLEEEVRDGIEETV